MFTDKQLQLILKNWVELNKAALWKFLGHMDDIQINSLADLACGITAGDVVITTFSNEIAQGYLEATISFPNSNLYFCVN